jgi:large subunit ribosomal protein L21
MYAVIRAGGKQYRVAPGDVFRVEKQGASKGTVELELLAIGDNGVIVRPEGGDRVAAEIVGEGRAPKILVFHFKRKKQYKKLNGHRQPFTTVRITEITHQGQTVSAAKDQSAVSDQQSAETGAAISDQPDEPSAAGDQPDEPAESEE